MYTHRHSCILHELFISPTFSLTSENIKTQFQNKAAKYKVFCISCQRRDLLWCHWDLTFSCLEQCFSTVVLDVAGCPISTSFLERKLMGEWSEREARREEEEEKRRPRTRLPHACQYSAQSQFSRDGRGGVREHHDDNPQTPKIRTSKVERHPIQWVGDRLLQSFTSH